MYEGRTDEITSSYGFIDLNTENKNDDLLKALEAFDGIDSVKTEIDGMLIATLSRNVTASEMNQFLFDKGIVVSHLVKRKPSLEQQFLTLTNDK